MANTKYEFIGAPVGGLRQIRALRSFGNVKEGDLGGWLAGEHNLSTFDSCWVADNARVLENAYVGDWATVGGDAVITDSAQVRLHATVGGSARVVHSAYLSDYACVGGNASVGGRSVILGSAILSGVVCVQEGVVTRDAILSRVNDVFVALNVGSENGMLTVYRGTNGLMATRGCFVGTVEQFLDASASKHDARIKREYELLIQVARSRIGE